MNKEKLFRKEALASYHKPKYGTVLLNNPVKYWVIAFVSILFMIAIVIFIFLGEFSEKFIVRGYLESSKGLVNIYSQYNGVIEKCFVKEGQVIEKGTPLVLLTRSAESTQGKPALLKQLEKKKIIIEKEVAYKQKHLKVLKQLLLKRYLSLDFYHQKHQELIALETAKNNIETEIIKYKQQKSYIIHSPRQGSIASLLINEGQTTNLLKPLLKILPSPEHLIGKLFIPIKQAGFLENGMQVFIHYDAYPQSRFGSSKARISQISQTVLMDKEEDKPLQIGKPYYKASAELEKQVINVYGRDKNLRHGMTFSAVIIGTKRKLWQWILDPLYSFYRR